jgi:1-acyl-sn-glycerol-3-phosphate acyltransferase
MFTIAYKYQLPIIPMAFSYREATGLFRLFKKNYPLITLSIGEPIMSNVTLSRKEAVSRLRAECHRRIVELAGITDNTWSCEGD